MPEHPSLRPLYLLQLFTVNITGGYHSRGLIPVLRHFIAIALNRFDNPFNYWGPELYEGHHEERMKAVRWARLVLLLHAAAIVFFVGIGEPILAVLVSGSIFFAGLAPVLRRRDAALRTAKRRSGLPEVHPDHHPRSGDAVPVLAHELARGAPHVRRGALLQPREGASGGRP